MSTNLNAITLTELIDKLLAFHANSSPHARTNVTDINRDDHMTISLTSELSQEDAELLEDTQAALVSLADLLRDCRGSLEEDAELRDDIDDALEEFSEAIKAAKLASE